MALGTEHKLSVTECKKILHTDGLFYTDEEIIKLRDLLYHLVDIALDELELKKKGTRAEMQENKKI